MRAIVVGAGAAGLAVARALRVRGIDFEVLERRAGVGGMWRLDGDGRSPAYRSLRANVSRQRTAYRGFPLARRLREPFPSRDEMQAYLEAFAARHDLTRSITTGAEVTSAERVPGGGWRVLTADGAVREADALVCATGLLHTPRVPDVPGTLRGPVLHAAAYEDPEVFAGRDVLVVGLGCTGSELATEVAAAARSVTLAVRSGNWVVPRRLFGVPMDWNDTALANRLPWPARRRVIEGALRLSMGRPGSFGLPAPPLPFGSKPVGVTDGLVRAIAEGAVRVVRAAPAALRDDHVLMDDGSRVDADAVLWGTGYDTTFPFLPADVDPPTYDRARLYRGIAHAEVPGLLFCGIAWGNGALIPMMDAQAEWIGEHLAGRLPLPAPDAIEASLRADSAERAAAFGADRFQTQWDRLNYARAVRAEAEAAAAGRALRPEAATGGMGPAARRRRLRAA